MQQSNSLSWTNLKHNLRVHFQYIFLFYNKELTIRVQKYLILYKVWQLLL